jgi:hypothetical protein
MNAILRHTRASVLATLAIVAAVPASAQELPPAEQLVERYVQAIGGRDAVLRPQSTRMVGTFSMPAAGLTGDLEVIAAKPNHVVTIVNVPGMGMIRSGFDGTVGWALDPMSGARLLTGPELDAMREQANPLMAVRDPSLFQSMETVERTEMGGQPCYRVRAVTTSGRETFDCYHVDSGLLVAQVATQESPMGSVETTTIMTDYRDFGGVLTPTTITQNMMGMQQIMGVTSVEYDAVDPSAFALPAEIHALMGH